MRVTLVVLLVLSAPAAAAPRPVTVFLERHGQTVTTRSGDEVDIPAFGGGDRVWNQVVGCVKQHFAPFQVEIVTQRPAGRDYMTALVGGRASLIGLNDRTTNGIGPYDGSVLRTATVHIFSRVGTGERDADNLCAVAAHEIGHSLGLDHSHQCGDLMSYYNDECGTQRFMDVDAPCGEYEDRACGSGEDTQNSYRRLARLVGLKRSAPQPEPQADPDPEPEDPYYDDEDEEEVEPAAASDDDQEDVDDEDDDEAEEAPPPAPAQDPWAGDDAPSEDHGSCNRRRSRR